MKTSNRYFWAAVVSLVICGSTFSQSNIVDKQIQARLIGVWQDSSAVGSGLTDTFHLFADGNYKFNYNQMDGTKRILSHSGKWKIVGGEFVLNIIEVEMLIGGKWVKASGSTATEFEIDGGKTITKNILPVEKFTLSIGPFIEEDIHLTTEIDKIKYWKLSDDPTAYQN